ncbi:hypothetical protein 14Stepyanka_00026 [Erwinia phage Stepyanka]|uniref:Phage protein n=1 Tax=Erwinia phage Stepyanka TaxID=2961688 RepID=A0A9E7T1M6_9CAUD|nr:hypothetical protein 14Stepyanka_00026 [Erwinia phage Stepyanka]
MSITKRVKVKFDMKLVFPEVDWQEFHKKLLSDSRKVVNGEKISGLDAKVVQVAVTEGPEAAVELLIKSGVQSFLREQLSEEGQKVSNVAVRFTL